MCASPPHGIDDSNQARIRPQESTVSTTFRPNDPTPPGISPNVTPSSQLNPDEMAAITDAENRHVDYDLHPLRVQGLDHYIDHPPISERFHIW
jgi:hypothetical protein